MRCPTNNKLPPPPPGKTGWPWTEETNPAPVARLDGKPWPKVSVVTASLNHAHYLEEAIRSVLLQGYPALEYIIIDAGSSDGSLDIIRKYEPWVSYWLSEPDEGPGSGTNKGIAAATGEIVGLMPSDDFYVPGGIQELVELRFAHPEAIVWIGACPAIANGYDIVDPGIPFINSMEELGDWGFGSWFNSGACLFDIATFRAVGMIDKRFFKDGADIDLWIRMAKAGTFVFSNRVVAMHRRILTSVSNRDRVGELSSWIASNYSNGNERLAERILSRYGQREAEIVVRNTSVVDFLRFKLRIWRNALLGVIADRR